MSVITKISTIAEQSKMVEMSITITELLEITKISSTISETSDIIEMSLTITGIL